MTSLTRPSDEFANFITHGLGFLLSLAAAVYLIARVAGQSAAELVAYSLYAGTLVLAYGSSTLSHLFYDLTWRQRCRSWDQACIFLLIAGTYTPLAVMYLNHDGWPWLLVTMWGLSGLGIWRVAQVCDLSRWDKLLYGFIGCLPAVALRELGQRAPSDVLMWIVGGGLCYLFGVPFLCRSASRRFAHATWHLLVMAGSACHYWAILLAVRSVHL